MCEIVVYFQIIEPINKTSNITYSLTYLFREQNISEELCQF